MHSMSLVEEAMKKAAVAWITPDGSAEATAVWCLWLDGALYVVSGPGEQPAPGLAGADGAAVTVRGDHGGRIVTWPAAVSRVEPGGADWQAIAPQLAAKRLNSPGGAEETIARWAAGCVLNRLVPAGEPTEAGAALPDDAQAAPPRPSPAAAVTRRPFRLHRVRRP
jgi:hypothetical protein